MPWRSETLRAVNREFFSRNRRAVARGAGLAIVAAVAGYLVSAHVGFPHRESLVFALLIFAGAYFVLLTRAVAGMERRLNTESATVSVLNRRINAHNAIYNMVYAAEVSLADRQRPLSIKGDWEGQELRLLVENVEQMIESNPDLYGPATLDAVKKEATEPGKSSRERVEAVIGELRSDLAMGRYLRG